MLAYLDGPAADLEWRRGWTHGILALVVLPLVLAGILLLVHRVRRSRQSASGSARLIPRQLLLLAYIAVLSHPILDTLNTYGVRWLMPFSGTWYYGDTLFIVDPWVWVALAVGVFFGWRRERLHRPAPERPARIALAAVLSYTIAMAVSGAAARSIIQREVESLSGRRVDKMMAGPFALNPLMRRFVVVQDEEYRVGRFHWLTRPATSQIHVFSKGQVSHPAARIAASTEAGRRFLSWARFPTFTVEQLGNGEFVVHLVDLRYAERPDEAFGTLSVPVTLR